MPVKDQRLEARVTASQKELFQRAAAIQGLSLTEFMITNLQESAMRLIKDHDVMTLRARDKQVFIDALLNPPKPNRELRQASLKHREVFSTTDTS